MTVACFGEGWPRIRRSSRLADAAPAEAADDDDDHGAHLASSGHAMKHVETTAQHAFGDTTVRYLHEPATGRVGIELYPTAMTPQLAVRRR